MRVRAIIASAVVTVGFAIPALATPQYSIQYVPSTFAGGWALPAAINNAGEVTGTSFQASWFNQNLPYDAFVFQSGGTSSVNLGTAVPGNLGNSMGVAINNNGEVTGVSSDTRPGISAAVWNGTTATTIGTFQQSEDVPGDTSQSYGINDSGTVVGWSYDDANSGAKNGFIYSNGQLTRMPNGPGGYVYAVAINNSGVGVGTDSLGHGFSYQNGVYTDLGSYGNLGSLSGGTGATAINSNGLIVGYAQPNAYARAEAAEFTNGQWQILGTLPGDTSSNAIAVNDNGDVLGVSQNVVTDTSTPFLYTGGQMYDLLDLLPSGVPNPATNDYTVTGMNDAGQIVGYIGNIDAEAPMQGFVLTPVPEPGTVLIFLLGVIPIRGRRNVRRD